MAAKRFTVVSYDISDDKRRRKVMQTLEDFGRRVQYSVFECLLQPAELARLRKRLKPHVRDPQDSIRFYFLGAEDVPRILVLGSGSVTQDPLVYLQ